MPKTNKAPHAIRNLDEDVWTKLRELCLAMNPIISANEGVKRLIHAAVAKGKLPNTPTPRMKR